MGLIQGSLPVIVDFYEEAEREQWNAGNKKGFPWDPRLVWTVNHGQPTYYFGETWYVRELLSTGHVCWSDTFQLFQDVKPESPFYVHGLEIRGLLGQQKTKLLAQAQSRVTFTLKNPDVVAYHPEKKEWSFFELKLPGDTAKEEQINTLALLHHMLGANVALVQLNPKTLEGKRTASTANYQFQLNP